MSRARCDICPRECLIPEGQIGFCTAQKNIGGVLTPVAYGKITASALDPIEKKPLYMFFPGKKILSIGSYGCNLRCAFCQNHEIAIPNGEIRTQSITPQDVLLMAKDTAPQGNIGVAYTYNEPLINYEFVYDCARLIAENGMKNVLVTNGFINAKPLENLLPHIHAMNIDLKAFTQNFYEKVGGDLETVKNTIATAQKTCHVEVTTLVIPGENDDDIVSIAKWLASVNPEIPLHLSRFFPRHHYSDRQSTPHETVLYSAKIARKYLKNVFEGNM